jgi:hypothetical protein
VVVPTPEEFQGSSLLLSAMTVERRVRRLLAAGELPPPGACARCGRWPDVGVVDLWLECERSQVRATGGSRPPLVLPFLSVILWLAWWEEERRVEILGHDTAVPVPLAFCPECARGLPCPRGAADLAAGAAVLALSACVSYFTLLAGIALGLVGLAAVLWWAWRRRLRWHRDLKALLRQVPAYGQLLDQYRFATVVVPDDGAAGESEP